MSNYANPPNSNRKQNVIYDHEKIPVITPDAKMIRADDEENPFYGTNMREWVERSRNHNIEGLTAARLQLMRYHLMKFKKNVEEYDQRGGPILGTSLDDMFLKDPTSEYCVTTNSTYAFLYTAFDWYQYVRATSKKWQRRLDISEYIRVGKVTGIWGSPFGLYFSRFFPEFCGMNMNHEPEYFSVLTPQDHRCYHSYTMLLDGPKFTRVAKGAAIGFLGTVAVQLIAPFTRIPHGVIPTIFRQPLAGVHAAFFVSFLGFMSHWNNKQSRAVAMDKLLHAEGCYMAAKMRKIADDVMWPSEQHHNRWYLQRLPRDKWDEFVWNTDDDRIAAGFFPEKWEWAKKEKTPPEVKFWQLPGDLQWKWVKGFWDELNGGPFMHWNKVVLEVNQEWQQRKNLIPNPDETVPTPAGVSN